MKPDKQHTIKELTEIASGLLTLKQNSEQQRRPLLIEFCGTPKSGKTTTINSLDIFLRRNNFRTVILTERASVCPIGNKKHPFFNLWTLTSGIAEILRHLDQGSSKYDIIIADRGIFDALCWFEWLNINSPDDNFVHLDDKTYESFKAFIFNGLWKRYIDLIYVFTVNPETSIEREYANLLTDLRGSIMSEKVLKEFNNAIKNVMTKYKHNFRNVIEISTDAGGMDDNPNLVSYNVTKNILNNLGELLVERIGYFENDLKNKLKEGINSFNVIENLEVSFDVRTNVEKENFIQPIPIAVITNHERNKVLVVKKNSKKHVEPSPEEGKLLPYIGGHMRQEDKSGDENTSEIFIKTLYREINEEIGESIVVQDKLPFLIYTPENYRSERHLAICYIIEMGLEGKKFTLHSDEFVSKTGTSLSGHVVDVEKIADGKIDLGTWGEHILKHVFNKNVSSDSNLFSSINS